MADSPLRHRSKNILSNKNKNILLKFYQLNIYNISGLCQEIFARIAIHLSRTFPLLKGLYPGNERGKN